MITRDMNQKEILALGMIVTFVFSTVITTRPADALFDDKEDYVTQTGSPPNINTEVNVETAIQLAINSAIVTGDDNQLAINTAMVTGDDNTAFADSGQTADHREDYGPSDSGLSDDRTDNDDITDNFDAPSIVTR